MATIAKTKFDIGDPVQSAPDSSDVTVMKRLWVAEVHEMRIIKDATITDEHDGICYVTVGYWEHSSKRKRPTSRQLHSQHLIAQP